MIADRSVLAIIALSRSHCSGGKFCMTVALAVPPLTAKNRHVRLFGHVRLIGQIR